MGRFGLLMALFAYAAMRSVAYGAPQLQVFIQVEGTVPDWVRMDLTIAKLEIGGIDPVTGKRFLVTAFSGAAAVSIPRSAAGSARFVVAGPSRVGNVDRALLTLQSASLVTQPPDGGTSPKNVPIAVQDNALKVRPPEPVALREGETVSLLGVIRLGKDAVLTRQGVLALNPTLVAGAFTPSPESFVNGAESVTRGPDATFSELGVQVSRSKILDPATGALRDLTLQKSNGALVSFSDLRSQNEELWRTRHGALNPRLVQRLAALSGSDLVTAEVLVRIPGPQTLETDANTPEAWDLAHATFVTARNAAADPVVSALAAQITAAGATVISTRLDLPALRISASRDTLESVARLSGVVEILEAPTDTSVLATNAADDLVQEPLQLAHLLGVGRGLRVALMDFKPCIKSDHEAFRYDDIQRVLIENAVTPCDPAVSQTGDTSAAGHSTFAAGAFGAFVPETWDGDPWHVGTFVRPPAGLVGLFQGQILGVDSCSYPPTNRDVHLASISCIDSLLGKGPESMVRGGVDNAVYAHRIFVASGSGNVSSQPLVGAFANTAFCYAYNAVCVGGYGHNDTIGPANFGDDVPVGGWANGGHREKPDLVGPNSARLPNANPPANPNLTNSTWTLKSGTSFATPFVVGLTGLLMANFPQHLLNDPTLTRAVLMASASHSFAGYPRVPNYSDDIDDRAGAGAPRGDRARDILQHERFISRFVKHPDDFTSTGYMNNPITFEVNENDRIRIVLTYDQCQVSDVVNDDVLLADLDLIAVEDSFAPSLAVHTNNSHVDNTEILEFTVPRGARVNVRTRAQFWNACSDGSKQTHLAIAWDVRPGSGPVFEP